MNIWFIILLSSALTLSKPVKKSLNNTLLLTDNESLPEERKIEKKTIFIAPTINCAHGYFLDLTGECRKIVKLNEQHHFQFILEKLEEKFGNLQVEDDYQYEIDESNVPFQINIPLFEENSKRTTAENVIITTSKPITTTANERRLNLNYNKDYQTVNSLFFLPPKYNRKDSFVKTYQNKNENVIELNTKFWDWLKYLKD